MISPLKGLDMNALLILLTLALSLRVYASALTEPALQAKFAGQSPPSDWFTSGQNADVMLSGIDFNNTGGPLLFNHPGNVASDGTRLLLADRNNNRVLIWNSLPAGNSSPDIVLGQDNFYTNNPGTELKMMNWPVGVSTDGQRVVVADTNNDRVLIWNTFPTRNGQSANLVIQGDISALDPKRRIEWPWGVWTKAGKLVVACTRRGSVLIWNSFPTQTNQTADICLTAKGDFGTPRTITSDGVYLIVGDHNPSIRVTGAGNQGNFFWKSFPASDDQPYDFFMSDPADPRGAWMQGDFTPDGKLVLLGVKLHIWNSFPGSGTDPPALSIGKMAPGESGYRFNGGDGSGAACVGGRLYLSLSNGNKIVSFNALPTVSTANPDFAVGAPDVNTNTLETNSFITNPVPVSDGISLFVSSDFDRKLYIWKRLPNRSGIKPDIVCSLPFDPWDSELFGNTYVLAGRRAVCVWRNLPRNGEPPDLSFVGSIGNVVFQDLRGVALDNRYFYLADRDANKVYIWEGIPNQNANPKFSIDVEKPTRISSDGIYLVTAAPEAPMSYWAGQIRFYRIDQLSSTAQPTYLSAMKLNLPEMALPAGGHLFLADTCYNRVLIWKTISDALAGKPPEVVLGARDFVDTTPEIGIDKLFMPGSVSFDGRYLWVGEFKFSGRILRFSLPVTLASVKSSIIDAAARSVHFIRTGNMFDDSALGFVYGKCANPQNIIIQTDSTKVDQVAGTPLFSGSIVLFGGRAASRIAKYYEDLGFARITYSGNSTHHRFMKGSTPVYSVPVSTYVYDKADYFVVQIYMDGSRTVFSMWGFAHTGTYASGVYFADHIYPNLASLTQCFYVCKWTDLNNDGTQQSNEITVVASGT